MATYYNIRTGETLTQEDFSARICDVDYTCCSQFENVWISGNVAKNEYQWQVYFIENNLCSDGNAPVNTVAPAISGVLIVGQTLTRVAGTWTADLPITTTWVWKSNGTTVQTGGATYVVQASDVGKTIVITETASDDDGSANASSVGSVIFDTILDTYSSSVITAHSVTRLLRGAYYGSPIIRVRRSGDNAESDFGVTTSGELNTASLTAFCIAGGGSHNGFITTVYGQSGASINMTQTTPSSQLQIVSSGAMINLNSKAGMQGASGRSMNVGTTSTYNAVHNGTSSFIHFVGSLNSVDYASVVRNTNGSFVGFGVYSRTTQRLQFTVSNGTGTPISAVTANNSYTNNSQVILGINVDADNATASARLSGFFNGGSNVLTNASTATPSATNAGITPSVADAGFNSQFQELIVWGVDMSANRTTLRDKTNAFYGTY